jgi:rhomboid protease GluP
MWRRAPLTTLLLAAIGAVFAADALLGGWHAHPLIDLGANQAQRVAQGELWRPLTSVFLHLGLFHLGQLFEVWLGSVALALVYFASGLAGSLASLAFTLAGTDGISAGASGAIFGILGALIGFLARRRDRLSPEAKSLLVQLLVWAAINVVLGFSVAVIDNAAHLGGFAVGLGLGFVLPPRVR